MIRGVQRRQGSLLRRLLLLGRGSVNVRLRRRRQYFRGLCILGTIAATVLFTGGGTGASSITISGLVWSRDWPIGAARDISRRAGRLVRHRVFLLRGRDRLARIILAMDMDSSAACYNNILTSSVSATRRRNNFVVA